MNNSALLEYCMAKPGAEQSDQNQWQASQIKVGDVMFAMVCEVEGRPALAVKSSPELAERIILKAQTVRQVEAMPLTRWVRRIFAEFHLPQPAYVLSGTLIVGFLIGIMTPADTPSEHPEFSVQSFLYADEDIL